MAVKWKWGDGEVTIGKQSYKILRGKLSEVAEFTLRLDIARSTYRDLEQAHLAFRTGRADYARGWANLKNLRAALADGAEEAGSASADLGAFFDPPTIADAFKGHEQEFGRFAEEALGKLTELNG